MREEGFEEEKVTSLIRYLWEIPLSSSTRTLLDGENEPKKTKNMIKFVLL